MKKGILMLIVFLCLTASVGLAEAGEEETAEWTVMFYMCGSDLESKYEFASQNLAEIVQSHNLSTEYDYYAKQYKIGEYMQEQKLNIEEYMQAEKLDRDVHVVIETGGCKEWHNQEQEITTTDTKIRTDVLQRWTYDPYNDDIEHAVIRLQEEIPLASMSDPETLTDFIRWSAANYPAKKYMLVMWDHGGGSKTGILVDELFNNDILYLYEMKQALEDSGIRLEAVLFDACLMANIETAYAIRNCANWMIASEEVVTGAGTSIRFWLSELCNRPGITGEILGRLICDSAQEKCADLGDEQGAQLLTWSVIRLSEIDAVAACMEKTFHETADAYSEDPFLTSQYLKHHGTAEHYGSIDDRMIDLSGLYYNAPPMEIEGLALRNEMLDALERAVVYCVRGSGRARSKGLSFCWAVSMSAEELDIYCRNCPCLHYLALLDAISPWTAPDTLYEHVGRLPEINEIEGYDIILEKTIGDDGTPGVILLSNSYNVNMINCCCCWLDEETGKVARMGYIPTHYQLAEDGDRIQNSVSEIWSWPSVDEQFCCVDLIEYIYGECLYEIPVQIDSDVWYLRCGYTSEKGYEVYGVWSGFNSSTKMFNRNVTSLSKMAGQSYRMLYPICDLESRRQLDEYQRSEAQRMPRALYVENQPIPPGTYYIQYVVEDMFLRRIPMEGVKVVWDGETLSLADGESWEGTVQLYWE